MNARLEKIVNLIQQGIGPTKIAQTMGVSVTRIKQSIRRVGESMGLDGGASLSIRIANERRARSGIFIPPDGVRFTAREEEMLAFLANGLVNREIGGRITGERCGEQVVKNRFRFIFRKIGTHTRAEAAAWYWKHCVEPSSPIGPIPEPAGAVSQGVVHV